MNEYEHNRIFADSEKHKIRIKEIVESMLHKMVKVETADFHRDIYQATDYIVTVIADSPIISIGCRVRSGDCYEAHGDFTIRAVNGEYKTELDKVLEGWPRWYLYGWDYWDKPLHKWVFVDMDILRAKGRGLLKVKHGFSGNLIPNKDGRTSFIYIKLDELDAIGCIAGYNGITDRISKIRLNHWN